MTKEEAVKVMERYGYCPIHGCKLTSMPAKHVQDDGYDYCQICEREEELRRVSEVEAAKKVLGLA